MKLQPQIAFIFISWFASLTLLLAPKKLQAQEKISISADTVCLQIKNTIEYLKKDKRFKKFIFNAEKSTRYEQYGIGDTDYVQDKLGFRNDLYYLLKNEEFEKSYTKVIRFVTNPTDTMIFPINCQYLVFQNNLINTIISKIDNQTLVISLDTTKKKMKQKHYLTSYGSSFLFFFNKDQSVRKVKEYSWVGCG